MKSYDEKYNMSGHEIMDNTPIAVPTRFRRSLTLQEQIQLMIKRDMSRLAQQNGYETYEEADDFDVDDDPEMKSPYQLDDEIVPPGSVPPVALAADPDPGELPDPKADKRTAERRRSDAKEAEE